jgi:hypothetical protein
VYDYTNRKGTKQMRWHSLWKRVYRAKEAHWRDDEEEGYLCLI